MRSVEFQVNSQAAYFRHTLHRCRWKIIFRKVALSLVTGISPKQLEKNKKKIRNTFDELENKIHERGVTAQRQGGASFRQTDCCFSTAIQERVAVPAPLTLSHATAGIPTYVLLLVEVKRETAPARRGAAPPPLLHPPGAGHPPHSPPGTPRAVFMDGLTHSHYHKPGAGVSPCPPEIQVFPNLNVKPHAYNLIIYIQLPPCHKVHLHSVKSCNFP